MPLLVRKVEKAKWLQRDIANGASPSADAVTNCMRTTQNALSTWKIDSMESVHDAVLAMVAAGDHLETIDVVFLDQDDLIAKNIALDPTAGNTPVESLRDTHVDIKDLDLNLLGELAKCVCDCIARSEVQRFTVGQLKSILRTALVDNKLSISDLKESVARKVS